MPSSQEEIGAFLRLPVFPAGTRPPLPAVMQFAMGLLLVLRVVQSAISKLVSEFEDFGTFLASIKAAGKSCWWRFVLCPVFFFSGLPSRLQSRLFLNGARAIARSN